MKKHIYYIIAIGGYLKKPEVQKVEITQEEIDEAREGDEEDEDVINYLLSEEEGAYNQGFSKTISLSEKEFKEIQKLIGKL